MPESLEHFDLVVVGTGSGNSVLTPDFDDWRVALVERDVFGGTCLNRGCIPSKMFVYAADVAHQAGHTGHLGVDSTLEGVRWPEIVGRVFGRIDPIAQGGEEYRHSLDNVTVFNGDARFTGHKVLEVSGQRITGDHIVLAAGARPFIPPIPGLDEVPFHTSDTVMRLESLPERMTILGGGYIAAELGHVFDAMGVVGVPREPVTADCCEPRTRTCRLRSPRSWRSGWTARWARPSSRSCRSGRRSPSAPKIVTWWATFFWWPPDGCPTASNWA